MKAESLGRLRISSRVGSGDARSTSAKSGPDRSLGVATSVDEIDRADSLDKELTDSLPVSWSWWCR